MTVEPRDGRISSELYATILESSRADSSLSRVIALDGINYSKTAHLEHEI
jgi:hypothetical protein